MNNQSGTVKTMKTNLELYRGVMGGYKSLPSSSETPSLSQKQEIQKITLLGHPVLKRYLYLHTFDHT